MNFISSSPIEAKKGKDLFNFRHYAKKVQKIIQNNSGNIEPLTIGVYGNWGGGKTSFLNLVEEQVDLWKKGKGQKGILKYHFNPWRYSTEEEMLFDFFDGLSKKMIVERDSVVQKVGKQLVKYSRYTKAIKLSASVGLSLSNKVGATFDVSEIMKALGEDLEGKELTLEFLVKKINTKLKKSSYKIIVFIDDIDRLDKNEVYTILKLIKLNANFNNFVYLVALDKEHVAKAIGSRYGESKEDGELFLEKIINVPIFLPKIEKEDFRLFFDTKLKEVIDNLGFSNREEEISQIRNEFSYQYFNNGREVIRVFNSFFVSAFAIGEEVHLRDLFWVEYLKVKHENVFNHIKNYHFPYIEKKLITIVEFFGEPGSLGDRYEILEGESNNVVSLLFPNEYDDVLKQRLEDNLDYIELIQKDLRINSIEHFEKYFSYHMERKVSVVRNKQILKHIINKREEELKKNLIELRDENNLEAHRFYNVIEELIKEGSIDYVFFYDFLFSNLELLPIIEKDVFGLTYQLRMIELVASNLDTKKVKSDDVIQLGGKLTTYHLCHFTRKIKSDIELRKKLDKLIVKKVKEEYINQSIPFFYDLTKEHSHYKMIMSLWKENDEESFLQYINKHSDKFDNILKLIRNFAGFWNNEFFDNLEKSNYDYMKNIIDVDKIYQKIKKLKPELIKYNLPLPLNDRPSELENLKQFIFFYQKDKKIIK